MGQRKFDESHGSQTAHQTNGRRFGLVVCAAPQSRKWWANQNPEEDLASVQRLMDLLGGLTADRLVLISTVDVFPVLRGVDESFDCHGVPNHAYGRNRLILEDFVRSRFANHHVVRLPGLFGPGLKKNGLFDLMHRNQLDKLNLDSVLQWYDITRLWTDVQVAIAGELRLVVLAVPPVRTGEIHQTFFPSIQAGGNPDPLVYYDVRTRHGRAFGSTEGYCMGRRELWERLSVFFGSSAAPACSS